MNNLGTISDAPPRPEHNFERAQELIAAPKKSLPLDLPGWTQRLVEQGRKKKISNPDLSRAIRIYERPAQRIPLEAFIFGATPSQEISTVLEVPVDTVRAFRELFFDVDVAFPSKLEKVDYIDQLAITATQNLNAPEAQQHIHNHDLKKAAFYLGSIYLKWQFSPEGVLEADVAQMLEIASTDMFVRGMAHRLNPIDSNSARSARECYTLLTKAAGALKVMRKDDDPTAVDAILMLLKTGPSEMDENLEAPTGVTASNINSEE